MSARIAAAAFLICLVAGPALAQTRIGVGREISGALTASDPKLHDDSHFDCYVLEPAQDTVTIDLRSDQFDAYLVIGTGESCGTGFQSLEFDDNSGGGKNARIVSSYSRPRFLVMVNSVSGGETGAYRLTVTAGGERPPPPMGRMGALPQGISEWGVDAETCTGAYMAMEDAGSGVEEFGNVGHIDYAARARTVDARRPAYSSARALDIISDSFVIIGLGGVLNGRPEQTAEYLEALAACDRAFGFTPVTIYR